MDYDGHPEVTTTDGRKDEGWTTNTSENLNVYLEPLNGHQ